MATPQEEAIIIQLALDAKRFQQDVMRIAAEVKRYAAQMKTDFATVGSALKITRPQDTGAINAAVSGLQNQAKAAEVAAQKMTGLQRAWQNFSRVAVGTLTAVGIFQFLQLLQTAIKKSIDSLVQLELAFYKLGIAERAISKAGVDITPQQLLDIAKSVTNTYVTVSKIDALKMISNLAVLTKDLKLTSKEYEKLALAIPLVSQQAGVSIESATDQVITGLTKSGRGWADLGITVDAEIIKQEAVNSHLVESRKAYEALTAEQKQQVEVLALIGILSKNTDENLESQEEYLDSVAGKLAETNKLWETLTTTAGTTFAPAIKAGLEVVKAGLIGLLGILLLVKMAYVGWMAIVVGGFFTIQDVLQGNIKSLDDFGNTLIRNMHNVKVQLEGVMNPELSPDTPTIPEIDNGIDEEALKMKEALDKLNEDILQAELKLKQDMQDVAIDLGRKMVDITLEYETKRAELAIDYANKIADINRNYAQKIEDINIAQHESQEQSRQDELERERAFQEKMLQLKEEFLMDLDDALHSRDARQILKLIKRYNLDKLQAEREHELAEQAAKEEERIKQESFERQRKAAQEARDRALEDARIDYERKLEELARQEQAEVEAAVLAANRKLADLEKENLDRNILIAAGLANDFATTATWLGMIDQLFTDHYGYVTGVYGAMMSMLSQPITMGSVSQSQGQLPPAGMIGGTENPGIGGYQTPTSDSSSASLMLSRGLGFDKGLTSLSKGGRGKNNMFTSLGGSNGADGKVSIELLLSPDLESRIVKNTLSKTAEVVTRVGKSKG